MLRGNVWAANGTRGAHLQAGMELWPHETCPSPEQLQVVEGVLSGLQYDITMAARRYDKLYAADNIDAPTEGLVVACLHNRRCRAAHIWLPWPPVPPGMASAGTAVG